MILKERLEPNLISNSLFRTLVRQNMLRLYLDIRSVTSMLFKLSRFTKYWDR